MSFGRTAAIYSSNRRAGIVTFASFTCQPRGALGDRMEKNQRLRELDVAVEPLKNRLFLASVTMPACPVGSRRQGASRRRTVLASPGPKCGAVDETATLAGNPRQSLPGLSQRQTFAPAATRAKLTQLVIEKRQTQPSQSISTVFFRFNGSAIRNA
jgi:hypothetical protein